MTEPDFIIIGAMKSATTTLYEQLVQQPGIFLSEPKEPNFFSDDAEYARGLGWYASLFAPAAPGDLRGEASTHYTKLPTYPQTVERLHAAVPDAKLIYVMRHPVDRLVSQYIHEWSEGSLSDDINAAVRIHPRLVAYSCYARQLQPYRDRFGTAAILPVFFERLLNDSQAELERVCQFLGYAGSPRWVDLEAQNAAAIRWRRTPLRRFIAGENPVMTVLRRRLVPKAWRDRIRASWTLQSRPELTPETRADLEAQFDADLAILGDWFGLPLSCASFADIARTTAPTWQA